MTKVKVKKSAYEPKWPIRPEIIPVSVALIKRLGILLLLEKGWDASPSQAYPQH